MEAIGRTCPFTPPRESHMDDRQKRTFFSFRNVLIFLDQHPFKPEPPLLAAMRKSLDASMRRIETFVSDQSSAKLARNTGVDVRRRKLRRERMMPLVRIARPLLA